MEIVKVSDTVGRRRGKMGFKMHGGNDVEIRVKELTLSILPVAFMAEFAFPGFP